MWYETLLPKLLNMSLTGSVVILAVLLTRLLLKRAPKVFSYALWAVVLFRLLCPVTISMNASLLGLANAPATERGTIEYIPADIVHAEAPAITLPVPGTGEAVSESLPQPREEWSADPLQVPAAIAAYLWLLGMAALVIYSAVSLLLLQKRLSGAVPLRENIYLADHIDTPFVMGLIRPKIYLPSALTEAEREYIILHEQYHIKRLDHVAKLVFFAALCLHWFNPFVWLAFSLMGRDMEMSCDEAVLRKTGEDIRADYSASLLRLATGKRIIAGVPLAFGEGDPKSRIKNVLSWKKPAIWVIIAAAVLCVAVGILCAVNPESDEPAGSTPTAPALQVSPPPGASLEATMPEPRPEAVMFTPADIHDLVSAELIMTYGSFEVTDAESLAWIETQFGSATEVTGGAESDFTIQLYLTRSDGTVGLVYPADNDWAMFKSGDVCYDWHSGTSGKLWTLFGVQSEHTKTEYNEAGQKLRETRYAMNEVRYVIEYEYCEYGLLRTVVTNASGEISTTEQEYEDGICVRVVYRQNGEIIGSMELEHDADGSFTRKVALNPDGTVSSITKIYYDYFNGEKLVSEQAQTYPESNRYTQCFEYDEQGNKIKTETYNADDKLLRTEEYEYSDSGELLKATAYVDGEVISRTEYVYNEAGELQNAYKYDGKGNLLQRQGPGPERPAA